MVPLPQPRPRRFDLVFAQPRPITSVAIALSPLSAGYQYFAHGEHCSWSGVTGAPNAEAAVLDAIEQIRAGRPPAERLRFVVDLPGPSPLWQHAQQIADAAPGIWVQRAAAADQPLLAGALARLPHRRQPAPVEPIRADLPPVTVAADGSVRGRHAGYGWLASSGDYGLAGYRSSAKRLGTQPVLVAELYAIGQAVCGLPDRHVTVLSDSQGAVAMANRWRAGDRILPPGYVASPEGLGCLTKLQHIFRTDAARIELRWVRGHCGHSLNEGADTLARLSSRYRRGDRDLDEQEYHRRAAGIARAFAAEFRRCGRASA